jgi:hypothetical protein
VKFKSLMFQQASGSLAGTVFSHNRGGQYTRNRSIPVNPGTVFQTAVRNFMADLTSKWNNLLTPLQRIGWNDYAFLVPLPDTLGEPRNVGGLGMYVRSNVPRLQAALARVDDAPTVYNLGELTAPTIDGAAAPNGLDIGFTNTDEWANEVGGALFVLASKGQNPSINFFKGPYRFTGVVLGAAVPPTSPASLVLPQTVAAGQQLFVQCRASRADGRLTSPFRLGAVVT